MSIERAVRPRRVLSVSTMAAACGITIVKKFTYRGVPEEWSNQYWLTGTAPSSPAGWRTLFDAIVLSEKTCYTGSTTVVRGYGYDSDVPNANAVWSVDLTQSPDTPVAGTLVSSNTRFPGDAAGLVRWKTSRLNTKGKPIYLRKYFHDVVGAEGSPTVDSILPAQVTAYVAHALKMDNGTLSGTQKITARGHTDVILNHSASPYATTRTLKRRGKRPPT